MAYPRQPLHAPHGAVATSHPLAAAAGLAVLRRGGNAVDAALATAITLTVVQPPSNDIGGDLFALVWDGERLHGLNASGRSPAALTLAAVRAATGGRGAAPVAALGGAQSAGPALPARGWLPVTVPGAPAGWRDLHDRFGRLPFADLFTDAVGYAEHGHPVSTGVAAAWARGVAAHAELSGPEYAEFDRVFAPGGRAPRPGERWRNPDAARTLRRIAETGSEDFYRGATAEALARHAARTGGLLTGDDLAGHTSSWVDPVPVRYRGQQVWELPPNGQGLAALVALGVLDGLELADVPLADRLHRQIEAVKLGFADAHAHVADPDLVPVPTAALLSPGYLAARRALITDRAGEPVAGDPERGGTVYLCTADAGGMMVSLIQSTYLAFGSHVVLPGHGFALQNRGLGFRLDPAHPNVVGPGRRPYHTIIPGFLTREGEPVGPFGVMGGHMQPQGHVQLVSATLDGGLDPQAALDAPRWYWHAGRSLLVEPELVGTAEGRAAVDELRARGHEVTVAAEPAVFGYGQAIWRTADGGYVAGSESRVDGGMGGF
ncbi:gamma-glutamyltranspeptidase / glutathione hydrolase [Micromonospora echinaurantiaca]|uniref:Gamma-glutamyltranspeptidase / glutathione hydrolase n=1 Tax=Micromonospora echinaurantiaca TaxID=47857 RepID=A0A1C5K5Y3_9ACTN|nr:gamma-glutamyltransferase family protein [Micromonospora echinaurantiaca]SCG78180.1 gamma-glutamyltranspeptidase / glutathione hydrolase [Micromonospora echinaurantiaca]